MRDLPDAPLVTAAPARMSPSRRRLFAALGAAVALYLARATGLDRGLVDAAVGAAAEYLVGEPVDLAGSAAESPNLSAERADQLALAARSRR